MMDFEVKRCTRRCAASDRELQPGEPFYSMLIQQGAELVRQDFAESHWQGPPEGIHTGPFPTIAAAINNFCNHPSGGCV